MRAVYLPQAMQRNVGSQPRLGEFFGKHCYRHFFNCGQTSASDPNFAPLQI
jgi:hypothetical protein